MDTADELTFSFDRRADEYVDGAFAASYRLQKGDGSNWRLSAKGVIVWVLVFLIALGAMHLAERGGFGANTVLTFVLGSVFGFLAMFALSNIFQKSLADRMKSVVKEGGQAHVVINRDGIRSFDDIADIGTDWSEAHMIWRDKKTLYVMTDMFVHLVPERALAAGQTTAQIEQLILMWREEFKERRVQ